MPEETNRSSERNIERTFGEKIGGSRYDSWHAGDILTLEDSDQMTEAERMKLVTKDHVWPKPDYEALQAEGISPAVLYYRKLVRDSLPAKANRTNAVNQYSDYIKLVSHARDAMERIKTVEQMDYESGDHGWLLNEGFMERSYGHYYTAANIYLTTKTLRAVQMGQHLYRLESDRQKKGFLMTREEKVLSRYQFLPISPDRMSLEPTRSGDRQCLRYEAVHGSVRYFYPEAGMDMKAVEEALQNPEPKTWLVTESYVLCGAGFPSRDVAEEWVLSQNPEEEKTTRTGKKRYTPPVLEHIVQTEHSIPIICEDRTGQDLIDTFGFRGGEFGEYESQNDRQANLNLCYTAFQDLSKALSIDPKDASLGEQLAIAFGARGKGGAMAHFEPLSNVINLTKTKGAGSLGHEWIHALDYAIGQALPAYFNEVKIGRLASNLPSAELRRDGFPAFAELLEGLKLDPKTYRRTEFYKNAQELDKTYQKDNGRYWASTAELLARAGACYILDKCREKDIRDDYLSGHAEGEKIAPHGEERRTLDHLFDNALTEWKEKGLLHSLDESPTRSEDLLERE